MKNFTKYFIMGPYHWKWYRKNAYGYADEVKMILSLFPERGSILDVGGGDGLMAYKFFQRGFKVTSIDSDPVAVFCGRVRATRHHIWSRPWRGIAYHMRKLNAYEELTKKGFELNLQSVYELDGGKKYDYTLCHEVIEHVPDGRKLVDIVMPVTGKYAVFTTPNKEYNTPGELDYKFYTLREFSALFGEQRVEILNDKPNIIARIWRQ
jgi:2-polyprenyl-3-methyl-5-hydroxy-6-metoxy-1,4-benzoquinol methylase